MDMELWFPNEDQTVRERYDFLIESGINFRSYRGSKFECLEVFDEIKAEYRISPMTMIFNGRKFNFKDQGVEYVVGIIPSCVREGRLYDDLERNAFSLNLNFSSENKVSFFGEICFLDSRLDDAVRMEELGLPSRAGFFVIPGLKFIEQFKI